MVALVVCENKNKHIGAIPLVPLSTNMYLHSYTKKKYYEWLQLIGFVFLQEEELVNKTVL